MFQFMKQDVEIYSTKLINKSMFHVSDKKISDVGLRLKDSSKIADFAYLTLVTCFYQFLHWLFLLLTSNISVLFLLSLKRAMYKTRNAGKCGGILGMQGIGEKLYSCECRQIFRGIFPNIPRNVVKYSQECPQTFFLYNNDLHKN